MPENKNLLLNGAIYLYGAVGDSWGECFTAADVALALAEHGVGDVTVRINSGGGIAFDGMAIYSLLKAHPGKVTIAIDGIAASAASLIAMAGDVREMRTGAMMMIHDPSGITIGPADVHEEAAARLHKIAENYAEVYAGVSGKPAKEVRDMMLATTWMSADEAVESGFATAKIDDAATAFAAFEYGIYANAPEGLPIRVRDTANAGAILPKPKKEDTMTAEERAAIEKAAADKALADKALADKAAADKADADRAAAGAKPWAAGFYASADNSGLGLADLNKIVAESSTHDQAKDKLIDAMASSLNADKPNRAGPQVVVGMEAREKFVEGATRAIMAKSPILAADKDAERNEFSGRRLFEIARMSLELNGNRSSFRDDFAMIGAAMSPVVMGAGLSSSDFVNILANVANKSMMKGYGEAAETFDKWTSKGSLSDFKTVSRVDLGLFPNLTKVEEGAEYSYAKLTDRGVTLALATYGKMFPITRQAIVNDDLNAFTKIPSKMGAASKRTIGNLVYAILTANAAMPDSVALFHATHKNLGTGALSVDTLDAARATMAKQVDKDAIAAGLNIRPKYWLGPVALEGKARQIFASQTEPGQANANLANRVAGMAEVIADARLDVASATAWYLAGDPSQNDTIEVSYLNGIETPTLEQKEGWNVDGVEFKVRQDAGVNVLDHIALYKSSGQ